MKLSRIIAIVLILGGISTLFLSCAPRPASTSTTQTQIVTIQRGNLSVDITAVGNLALSQKEELAFEIPGTVENVLVEVGDTVTKGQVLVTLDTTAWDTTLTTLERAVTSAERTVTQKQISLRNAQNAIVTAQNTVTSKEFALRSAQFDLQTAQDAVTQIAEIKRLQDIIDEQTDAINTLSGALRSNAQVQLTQSKKDLQAILAGSSTTVSSNVALDVAKKQLTVEQKQLGIKQAQLDLDNAKLAVDDAKNAIAPAQVDVQNAQDDLKTAQKNLSDAKNNSPEVTAPFDGFITAISVKGGDVVQKGKVAVIVADPNKFEADLLVNETDISKVRLGAIASVTLQAVQGVTLTANITHIAPTATNQQGVVNYKVTVGIQPLELAVQAQRQSSANATTGIAPSGIPFGQGGPGFGGGNLTQEQITQAIQQRQQAAGGQFGRGGPGFGGGNLTQEQVTQAIQQRQQTLAGQAGGLTQIPPALSSRLAQTTATSAANIKLADGMTVTVSLPVESRTNVILAPNGAITTRGGQTSVKIAKADGTTEDRVIQTGISDYQYTEVTSGLNEGEKVTVTKTTTTSTTTTTRQTTTPVRIPGVGALGR